MGRIEQGELEELKRSVPIQRLVEALDIELRRHGAEDLAGLCPWHKEDSASLVVTPSRGLWHCFGCDAGGDVISWVRKVEGVSFRAAVELLRAGYPAAVAPRESARPVKRSTVAKLASELQTASDDQKLLQQVVRYYHEALKKSPEALKYLQKRGACSAEAIARFSLGFVDRTLGYRIPAKNRAAGADVRGRLQALGILLESGHERFRGCLVAPLCDEHGHVRQIYGRRVSPKTPKEQRHMLLPGPTGAGIFNAEALGAPELIVCESILDALTFWCAGLRHSTACLGAHALAEPMLARLSARKPERVYIAFDADEAGERGAVAVAEQLAALRIECFRVEFPAGQDANEFALQHAPAADSLAELLRRSRRIEPAMQRALASPIAAAKVPEASVEAQGTEPPSEEPPTPSSLAAELPAEPAAPPAAPAAASAQAAGPQLVELAADQLELRLADRCYRVRGLAKNSSLEQLRISLWAGRGEAFHQDQVELYSARQRTAFIRQAAEELRLPAEVIKRDVGHLLLALEELHERRVRESLAPKVEQVSLSESERDEALSLLRDPRLLERILEDFERCGIVGERCNKLVGYLSAVSRLCEQPLGVLVQSSSAAGKSSLMEAVLSFIPNEQCVKYSAMTGQALYYLGERDLRHKVLCIAEEQGAQKTTYALKLLLSEGKLSIASTGKDPQTGKLVTHEYSMEGPVMFFSSTTALEVDEELQNRCLVLSVDEGREQTRAIHEQQRRARGLDGLWAREDREHLMRLHQNAQRLLRPLAVVNPYAHRLTFLDDRTRTRRDHLKYLTLIDAIALLHQHQRPLRSATRHGQDKQYIEVALSDIELANRLTHEVLGRSLDELSPQTRRFAALLDTMAQEACERLSIERSEWRFTQREAREWSGWSDFAAKTHLRRLVDLEYVLVHRGMRGQSFVYELLYRGEGQDGRPFVLGLLQPERLGSEQSGAQRYEADREHPKPERERSKRSREQPGSGQGATRELSGSMHAEADAIGAAGHIRAQSGPIAPLAGKPSTASSLAAVPRNGSSRAAGGELLQERA